MMGYVMEFMDSSQSVLNWILCCWIAVLSWFGVKHYREDREAYDEILEIIESMRGTLQDLKKELARIRGA